MIEKNKKIPKDMLSLYETFKQPSVDMPQISNESSEFFKNKVTAFNEYGKVIAGNKRLRSVMGEIKQIVELAEQMTLKETDQWFDNVTVSRHMKQLKESYKVFEKTATEMSQLQQRLENSYNDIGTILERYYDISDPVITEGKKRRVNENSDPTVAKIKNLLATHVKGGGALIGFGKVLTSNGFKNSFSSDPVPCIIVKNGNSAYCVVNKKYAEASEDEIVGDYAVGIL